MPFIRMTIHGPTLTDVQVRTLQQGTIDLMVSVMHKPLSGIAVLVEGVPSGAWSIAGRPVPVAAHVEATVARGANTADEKARFIAEMWTLLRTTLGPSLSEATYIVIRETDTESYGRGGLTRAERDRRQLVETA